MKRFPSFAKGSSQVEMSRRIAGTVVLRYAAASWTVIPRDCTWCGPKLEEIILYVQHYDKYVLVWTKHHQRWLKSPHSESAFGEIATEPMERSLHLCYE